MGARCCRPPLPRLRLLSRALPADAEEGGPGDASPDALAAEWRDLLAQLGKDEAPASPPYAPSSAGTPFSEPPPPPAGWPGLGAWAWPAAPGPASASASAGGGAVDDTWDWGDGEGGGAGGYTPFGAAAAAAAAAAASTPAALGDGWWFGGDPPPADAPASPSSSASASASASSSSAASASPALASGATAAAGSPWAAARAVYVILFGVGSAETEGIYSLRACRADDGLPHDTIVAFERAADAARYAGRLEAAMAHAPAVCGISPGELLDFCADAGYAARLEPAGSLLAPPECNVGLTDWERSVRLRGGQWSVLPADPVPGAEEGAAATPYAPSSPLPAHPWGSLTNNAGAYPAGGTASPRDLDVLRARLERAWAAEAEE